jgi:hypothetical protein
MPNEVLLENLEWTEKTLFGDFKRRLNDPNFLEHTYEDIFWGYTDNVIDAYNNGWITSEQFPKLFEKAKERDNLLQFLPVIHPIVNQIDNRIGISDLSKQNLEKMNKPR